MKVPALSKERSTAKKEEHYTVADAVMDTLDIVVLTPVSWLFENTVGRVLDAV